MADFNYDSYNFKEEGKFWGAPQQITWHMDRFRDAHIERMSAQTMMIEVKFDALIDSLESIFTGKKEGTDSDESFYNMVQRENSETQEKFGQFHSMFQGESNESQNIFSAYSRMMKDEMDQTQSAITDNTNRVYGAIGTNTDAVNTNTNAVNSNTSSTKGAIESQTRTLTGTTYNVRGNLV